MVYQKKGMTNWIKVVSDYPNSRASKSVFEMMRPSAQHIDLSKYQKPFVVIDFVLGFRDELQSQTDVSIEDKDGKFVKTVDSVAMPKNIRQISPNGQSLPNSPMPMQSQEPALM